MAKTKAHGFVGAAINLTLMRWLPPGWCLWPESTIVLDPTNAPLPDFAVIRGADPLDFATANRYPGPGDVGIVIEVAVSSVREDLTTALELYARAMIPVYWVVDVPGRRIVVHSEPRVVEGRGEYARVMTYRSGETLPLVLDGQEVAASPLRRTVGAESRRDSGISKRQASRGQGWFSVFDGGGDGSCFRAGSRGQVRLAVPDPGGFAGSEPLSGS